MKKTEQKKTGGSLLKTVSGGLLAMIWLNFLTTDTVNVWIEPYVTGMLFLDLIKLSLVYISLPVFFFLASERDEESKEPKLSLHHLLLFGVGLTIMLVPVLSASFHTFLSSNIESEFLVGLIRLGLTASVGILFFMYWHKKFEVRSTSNVQ